MPPAPRRTAVLCLALLLLQSAARAAPHVPGEILVKMRPGTSPSALAALHAARGTRVLETLPALGVQRLAIPAAKTVGDMAALYAADPDCEFAEPNYVGRGGFVPDDTFFVGQWSHENSGFGGATPDADVDAPEGWDLKRGSEDVTVAVLDTGIESAHPEFQGRLLPGFDYVNEDADPEADHPHGVQVAGIVAANADNAFGVAGTDHFAKILPVKVLDQNNTGNVFDLSQGLGFAAGSGAQVINLSLINYPTVSATLNNALQAARDAGSILIACAGNGGIGDADVSGPGASPLTISVGATDDDDERASFSATGSALDVVAPGVDVLTAAFGTPVDTVSFFTGCSAATPIASGIATLMLARNPNLSHDEVRDLLRSSAEDQVGPPAEDTPGRDDFFGYGRLNLRDAVLAVPFPVPAAPAAPRALAALLVGGGALLALRGRVIRRRPTQTSVGDRPRPHSR